MSKKVKQLKFQLRKYRQYVKLKQEIINLLKENDYKGIVFTKFDTLKENENVKIVKITNDNPTQVLLANLDLVDNFIKEGQQSC